MAGIRIRSKSIGFLRFRHGYIFLLKIIIKPSSKEVF
jgi:hypothetical protein